MQFVRTKMWAIIALAMAVSAAGSQALAPVVGSEPATQLAMNMIPWNPAERAKMPCLFCTPEYLAKRAAEGDAHEKRQAVERAASNEAKYVPQSRVPLPPVRPEVKGANELVSAPPFNIRPRCNNPLRYRVRDGYHVLRVTSRSRCAPRITSEILIAGRAKIAANYAAARAGIAPHQVPFTINPR